MSVTKKILYSLAFVFSNFVVSVIIAKLLDWSVLLTFIFILILWMGAIAVALFWEKTEAELKMKAEDLRIRTEKEIRDKAEWEVRYAEGSIGARRKV